MEKLKNGIKINNSHIACFSKEAGIDQKISEKLLTSWSNFLKEHYDFLRIDPSHFLNTNFSRRKS